MRSSQRLVISDARRVPRALHPVAWWVWALALATAVSGTTNPLLLLSVLSVLAIVVARRRSDAPWARAFKYYLVLGFTVIAIRVVFRSILGGDTNAGEHVLFSIPRIPLPSWASGIQVGGPVTVAGSASALYDGLRLATLLCCVGAANTLANPRRMLRALPGALYELGVAVVIAFTIAPQLVESGQRVRRARKLRGGDSRGGHALRRVMIPVLEDALERSLRLAAAMDCRGYGRAARGSRTRRRRMGACVVAGMCALCVGAYGLLDPSTPEPLGPPAVVAGVVLCTVGLLVGSRLVQRTRYRPDPWAAPEWLVVASGVAPAVVVVLGIGAGTVALHPPTDPFAWPTLPVVPFVAIVMSALPAIAAPPPLRGTRGHGHEVGGEYRHRCDHVGQRGPEPAGAPA